MSDLKLESIQPWTPHPKAAPLTERSGESLAVAANGTCTCLGGWQLIFSGVTPGMTYDICWEAEHQEIDCVRDALQCTAYWGDLPPEDFGRWRQRWDFLLPETTGAQTLRFSRRMTAPEGVDHLMLRCTFRWYTKGESVWRLPRIEPVPSLEPSGPVTVAVVTGRADARQRSFQSIQDNLDFYVPLCEAACQEGPDLVVLPEVALQYGMSGRALDLAVPAPGPETEVFAEVARRHRVYILLGMYEQDGDAVHNSAILIDPDGTIQGRYRKVHLAMAGEIDTGMLPGDTFPVFETGIGRIGCNICMDSSAAESSRMVGLNGADFLLIPIMGDFRACYPEKRGVDPDRFRAIMRVRAMDNQFCVVVACNHAQGSCIIDHVGDVLAWNDGDQDFIQARVKVDHRYRAPSGGSHRGVTWMQRRPHLYRAFDAEENVGALLRDA
ncbi:MAG: carbon-nitrogen hydrolase family protein [Candidatus Latescibacteria bacterium]|nr:carbon-nitrogen hydrolase family protein [Candidatus Latescibacterota bacterium]